MSDATNPFSGQWIKARSPLELNVHISRPRAFYDLHVDFALGEDAERLTDQFLAEHQHRLDRCRDQARETFLASPAWQSVQLLRLKLADLQTAAATAETAMAEARAAYSQQISAGDPLTLLSTIRERTQDAETARREADAFELEVSRIEAEAQQGLRRAVISALETMRMDASKEHADVVAAIAASVDRDLVLRAALAKRLAERRDAADLAPRAGCAVIASEHDPWFALPPREEIPSNSPLEDIDANTSVAEV